MKKLLNLGLVLLLLAACKNQGDASKIPETQSREESREESNEESREESKEEIYGERPVGTAAVEASQLYDVFKTLSIADTLQTAFSAEVLEVCQAKGCWMRLALPEGEEVMVRFKDYGFFVPKDLAGSEVLVSGFAFISEVPEADRKHLAEDGGASPEAVSAISGAIREYGFEASGVQVLAASADTP